MCILNIKMQEVKNTEYVICITQLALFVDFFYMNKLLWKEILYVYTHDLKLAAIYL